MERWLFPSCAKWQAGDAPEPHAKINRRFWVCKFSTSPGSQCTTKRLRVWKRIRVSRLIT